MAFEHTAEALNGMFDALNEHISTVTNDLISRIEDLEAAVEELRYAGPITAPMREDDYDYYTDGEWDAL